MSEIIIPGSEIRMQMSLPALIKVAQYVLENKNDMKPGQTFSIEGTDKKKLIIVFAP